MRRRYLLPSFDQLSRDMAFGAASGSRRKRRKMRASSHTLGHSRSRIRGQGMIFDSVREYLPGDEVRHIDWSVTARTGTPHLKLFEEEHQRQIMLVVDNSLSMHFGTRRTFKNVQAARLAAQLAGAGLAMKERVGGLVFILQDHGEGSECWFPASGHRKSVHRMLKSLTRKPGSELVPREGLQSFADLCDALRRSPALQASPTHIVIISDFAYNQSAQKEAWLQALGRVARRHVLSLVAIDDPADYELPPMGRTPIIGPSGFQTELDSNAAKLRQHYMKYWHQNRSALGSIAQKLGVSLYTLSTTDDDAAMKQLVDRVEL